MFGSAVSVVGLIMILSYVDNVTAGTLLQSDDSIKLIGNERIDLSVQVLGRHKRKAPIEQCGGCNYSATPAIGPNHMLPCFVNIHVCTWVKKLNGSEKNLLEDIKDWCNWPHGKSEERTLYEAAHEALDAANEALERALKALEQGKKALNARKRFRLIKAYRLAEKAKANAKAALEAAKKVWRLAKEIAQRLCDKAKKLWNQLKKWIKLCSVEKDGMDLRPQCCALNIWTSELVCKLEVTTTPDTYTESTTQSTTMTSGETSETTSDGTTTTKTAPETTSDGIVTSEQVSETTSTGKLIF